ncbi:helix-turn-helix transcriptional regulator [Rhizobium bangladeshense]|uniref:winged helix-turn-helix transcriptional regulator n=1 Tax=Rhizobium bangladeshense TaxID=1138189 RepID=UPI001C83DFCD|nr:helix-turn-helix domain-containing protein [Rhizobium bangladeshense]MBX4902506.1 helix-turn-helix transcriptional regulator [Rhizobium bangladeshense]MBY3583822.1 helix-turn-helix transcriptional regulator [Rhizobium bangladeshense]
MKGKRTDMGGAQCGIARSLQAVGDWWSLLIVREAFKGRRRFSEFQTSLGLAKNILSVRLRKLVEEGILTVEPDPDSALSRLYLLTPKGRQLCVILVALWQWGEEHCFAPGELDYDIVDSLHGQPLQKLELVAGDGRPLNPQQFRIEARGR